MKKKFLLILLIASVAIIGLSTAYAADENNTTDNVTLQIKADAPINVNELANQISIQPRFKNYNQTTLTWLKEFDPSYSIFTTDDYFILMNSTDAEKITKNSKIGISINNNITCNILENKSLGSGLNNVLYIDNVELISQDVTNFDFDN